MNKKYYELDLEWHKFTNKIEIQPGMFIKAKEDFYPVGHPHHNPNVPVRIYLIGDLSNIYEKSGCDEQYFYDFIEYAYVPGLKPNVPSS